MYTKWIICLNKQLRVFFTSIDSCYSVYKVQLRKKLIVSELFNILCQYMSE